MSTRATIGLKRTDGKIDTIICWHDAYLDGAGRILQKHYDTPGKIEKLFAGGNVEELHKTIASCDYQYRGDDGVPEDCQAKTLRNAEEFMFQVRDYGQDYGYLFQDGQWYYYRPGEQLTPIQQ
jgi:hypothetical protein